MTYIINKTDGSILTEIVDSTIDTTATDLTLVGKNVTGYGEYLNENFVKLLENFASTTEPNNPIAGQLWFDQTEDRLKVYDGNGFVISAGPVVSGTPPLTPNQGDFWIDNREKQLYFYDGTRSRYLAGKIWGDNQGKSGFEVNTLSDIFGNRKTVTFLHNGGTHIGIFSHHLEFTPSINIPGFPTIKPGFNISSNSPDFKIYTNVESAEFLQSNSGQLIPVEDLLIFNEPNSLTETLTISNNRPLILGTGAEASILVGSGITEIRNQLGQDFKITTENNVNSYNAITIKSSTNRIGIFNNNPQSTLDVTGDVEISGNLTVNGTTTTVNTTELEIVDKNITLAKGSTSNETANGGGITLKGTTDKTFNWTLLDDAWTSSENLNLAAGKTYRINGVTVLSNRALAPSIRNATGLNFIGPLDNLIVGRIPENVTPDYVPTSYIIIEDGRIGTSISSTLTLTSGTDVIDVSNKRITNVAFPESPTDAVNKRYFEAVAGTLWIPVGFTGQPSLRLCGPNEKLLVDTITESAVVSLPETVDVNSAGTTLRVIDYNGTFASNPLTIVRYRKVDWSDLFLTNHGVSSSTAVGVYSNIPTSTDGAGVGLRLTVTITQLNTSYIEFNTQVAVENPGIGYRNGDTITVSGSNLGGIDGINDFVIRLKLDLILGQDDDLVVSIPNAAFSLVYTSPSQGWQYVDTTIVPLRTPRYTTLERDARTMSTLNYGEMIYNTDLNKIQAYISPGTWTDLN
jgi:hypothetical protein